MQPVLIYNPTAGKLRRNPEAVLQRIQTAMANGGLSPRMIPTTGPNQAGEIARRAVNEGADLIVVLGGDGTINEAAQGLLYSGVPLGILPGGTANVLAMELGLGTNLAVAAGRLGSCKPASVAVGRITWRNDNYRYFLLMCGVGLDAEIVSEVRGGVKAATGKFAYWIAGVSQMRRSVPAVQIDVNGKTFSCGFALISRVRNYGGTLQIASGASLRRDDFEVVLFEGSNPFRYAAYLMGIAMHYGPRMRGVHTLRASRVDIRTVSPTQIDGEFIGREAVTIEILPGALTLLMPSTYE